MSLNLVWLCANKWHNRVSTYSENNFRNNENKFFIVNYYY